ncbi:hypothetical protein [Calothrix sp. 336/3]|uniref:hypothetical protein n=1 Tax=Calothrix sp. 336/3 TaxID=1337936 RepID=UPI000A97EEA3|nr:hypothetical protein [Calothrix sp. 336/3]
MKISRKLSRELMLIALDLADGNADDLETMCDTLEAIAAEGRKEISARKSSK